MNLPLTPDELEQLTEQAFERITTDSSMTHSLSRLGLPFNYPDALKEWRHDAQFTVEQSLKDEEDLSPEYLKEQWFMIYTFGVFVAGVEIGKRVEEIRREAETEEVEGN